MDNYFNFISIDPGTTHIGFSIWAILVNNLEILDIKTFTLNITSIDKEIEKSFGSRFARLLVLEQYLNNLLLEVKPNSVSCESPFYFFKRPAAFAPLVETLYVIKKCVFNYDIHTPFITYDPSSIKNSIGAKGNSNKDTMKETLLSFNEIPTSYDIINSLDEHGIDSIAVGYCHYLRYILNINKIK